MLRRDASRADPARSCRYPRRDVGSDEDLERPDVAPRLVVRRRPEPGELERILAAGNVGLCIAHLIAKVPCPD